MTVTSPPQALSSSYELDMQTLGQRLLGMAAVAAFFDGDAGAAMAVSSAKGALDILYSQLVGDVAAYASKHPAEIPLAVSDVNAAKCLVRIADHAANIAKGALFVLGRGDMPR